MNKDRHTPIWRYSVAVLWTLAMAMTGTAVQAQETVCARVKIEIKQELTLERQGFDAEMRISNALPDAALTEVLVHVKVTDELGQPVRITSDPNDVSAQFFIRISNRANLGGDVDGTGTVAANTTAQINWLLIPSVGAAADNPLGKKFLVGATLSYRFGAEVHTLEVSPDVITVKPLPKLTLDYFLPADVLGDDPLTQTVEPVVPFTLGVRVKNAGIAPARGLKIDSAQPRIVDNQQGLLISFRLNGSYVDDAEVAPTLKLDFGQIDGGRSRMGRWLMEASLAGRFTEFTATYTHADELGGQVTSLISDIQTHPLLRDVRVDLAGRDFVRDFLAEDIDGPRVYESDGTESAVLDVSAQATLTATADPQGRALYHFELPPTVGFVYARLPDPFSGSRVLGSVVRSDGKPISPENVWLTKRRNPQTKAYEYWVSLFDVNTPGSYNAEFKPPQAGDQPPTLQLIADRTVSEGSQVSFLVEASSPNAKTLTLSAHPLPQGATFVPDASSSAALTRWVFDWTPTDGQAGKYPIQFTAHDGVLSAHRTATLTVTALVAPDAPQLPFIIAPELGVTVRSLTPELSARVPSIDDPATALDFELYSDAGLTTRLYAATVTRSGETATWQLPNGLNDNASYTWRVRGQGPNAQGTKAYSPWAQGRFKVNLANDAPRPIVIASPSHNAQARTYTPTLAVLNALDPDGDPLTYHFEVWADNALTQSIAQSAPIDAFASGTTAWTVNATLTEGSRYWWRAIARDPEGAQSESAIVSFTVNTGNRAPSAPVLVAPAANSVVPTLETHLAVTGSGDPDGDAIHYELQIDTTPTFSAAPQSSGLLEAASIPSRWTVDNLQDNTRYYWRARAQDAQGSVSEWTQADFFVNTANDAPADPVPANPGQGSTVSTVQPWLQAAPTTDPDFDPVSYQFELYADLAQTQLLLNGSASVPELQVPTGILQEGSAYYWHVRARDTGGLLSAWSSLIGFSVAPRMQPPRITLTAPTEPTEVTTGSYTLSWEALDPQGDATISLYYINAQDSSGTRVHIISGLRVDPNTVTGHFVWPMADLPPGTYTVMGEITNTVGSHSHQAPGALIVPVAQSPARIDITADQPLITTEAGGQAQFNIVLGTAPSADVSLGLTSSNPLEGIVTPEHLVFTPSNWNVPQTATVQGQKDCVLDGDTEYTLVIGRAASLDAHYNHLKANDLSAINRDSGITGCPSQDSGSTFTPNGWRQGLEVRSGTPSKRPGYRPFIRNSQDQEWSLGADTGRPQRRISAPLDWVSGRSLEWKLSYDGFGNGRIQVFHQGQTLIDRSYKATHRQRLSNGNAVRVSAITQAHIGAGNQVAVTIERINGHSVHGSLKTAGNNQYSEEHLYYTSPEFLKGAVLEGTVTWTFTGHHPPPQDRMRFSVHMGHVSATHKSASVQ